MLLRLSLGLALMFSIAPVVSACTCVDSPSPCTAFQGTPVVFVGLVKSIDEQTVDINRFGKVMKARVSLTAHFEIEEALKNINGREVTVITGGGGGDCGYNFKAGERYLVYGYRSEDEALNSSMSRTVITGPDRPQAGASTVTTSICSRTQHVSTAQDDLDLIRAMLKGKPFARVFGVANEFISKLGDVIGGKVEYKPKSGLTIQAGKFETQTDSNGRFRIDALPPGTYKLRLVMPEAYGMQYSFLRSEFDLKITPGCWGTELDFTVAINGRIGGRIYDAQGKPVGEQVEINLVTLASANNPLASIEKRSEYTNKQGQYEFDRVPPGEYLMGINLAEVPDRDTPYPKMYYPASVDRDGAKIINLGKGEKLDNLDIRLLPSLTRQTITGTVFLKNGRPAAKARVEVYDSEDPTENVWGLDVETDAQGRFSINFLKGRHYKVRAYLSEDYLIGTGSQSEMLDINPDDRTPLKIVLTRNGIFRDQK